MFLCVFGEYCDGATQDAKVTEENFLIRVVANINEVTSGCEEASVGGANTGPR